MKTRIASLVLALLVAGSAGAQTPKATEVPPGNLPNADVNFILTANSSNIAQIAMGHAAEGQGTNPGVIALGTRVASSHNKAEQGLRLVASRKHVDLPSETNADDHAEIAQLHSLPAGGQFDTQYVNNVIRDGDRMIVLYEAARNESIDPDIRQYADTMLPTLRDNRNQAQALVDQRLGN